MQKLADVRRRMASVSTIRSVASTLATVASAKLSRTRERAAGARAYAQRMREVVRRQQAAAAAAGADLTSLSPLLVPRPQVRRVMLLHLAADRGMCGAYNSAIDREAAAFVARETAAGVAVWAYTKGRIGGRFLRRRTGAEVRVASTWPRAGVTDAEVDDIAGAVARAFTDGEADEVWCTYTRFFTPMRREPVCVRLLPLAFEGPPAERDERVEGRRWFYEPDRATTVAELLAVFLRLQVYDVLVESFASEQGARMITMEEATERADRSLHELTVAANRLRREAITSDLIGVLFASAVRRRARAGSARGA